MNLKIQKKTILYMMFWFICLLPSQIIRLFPSYESYFQYILQAGLGGLLIYKYKIKSSFDTFQVALMVWLLMYLPGAFITSNIGIVALIKYICWLVFIGGLMRFFEDGNETQIYMCLKSARPVFLVYMLLTYASIPANATASGGVFFLGSRATTIQYFLCLLSICLFYDIRYFNRVSAFSLSMCILSGMFAISRSSGQGIMMIATILILLLFERGLRIDVKKRIRPIYLIAGIVLINYLIVTLSYLRFDFILDFIQNVLQKDTTLTGRSEIFTYSLEILSRHPAIGYGFDNNIIEATLTKIVAAYNTAHNSILQMMIDCGIIGAAVFLISNYVGFIHIYECEDKAISVLFYSIIAMYVGGVVSMIIPSNSFFLIWLLAICQARKTKQYSEI